MMVIHGCDDGAGSRNRTDTPVKEQVFETCASTNSAMPARPLAIAARLAFANMPVRRYVGPPIRSTIRSLGSVTYATGTTGRNLVGTKLDAAMNGAPLATVQPAYSPSASWNSARCASSEVHSSPIWW
jgi:hypothetical protein